MFLDKLNAKLVNTVKNFRSNGFSQVCNKKLPVLYQDCSVNEAKKTIKTCECKYAIVVNKDFKLCGYVTESDCDQKLYQDNYFRIPSESKIKSILRGTIQGVPR